MQLYKINIKNTKKSSSICARSIIKIVSVGKNINQRRNHTQTYE